MEAYPLVSIIIIFLNAERFIEEAVESVFAQTYSHWELILVDDGSTDRSTEIALEYARRNPQQVKYSDHPNHLNRGMSASRNSGIRNAQGEFIAFLDSDDVWLPQKLAEQVRLLVSTPEAMMVYGTPLYWNSWAGEDRDYRPQLGVKANSLVKPPTLLRLYLKGLATTPCPSDLLLRRTAIEKIEGFEEQFQGIYQMYEDQAFLAKLYLESSVLVTDQCWDKYRLHPSSHCAQVTQQGQAAKVRLFYLGWLANYLSEKKIHAPAIWKALKKERRFSRYPILRYFSPGYLARRGKNLLSKSGKLVPRFRFDSGN